MENFRPPTFKASDTEGYKKYLDKYGYVVIEDILPESVQADLIEEFWKTWTYVSPNFKRDDMSTWTKYVAPMMFAKGMASFSGLSQSDFMWKLRLRQEIKEIFEEIHNTKELCVSFDGFSVFFDKTQKNPKPWWHIDQHPDNKTYCVQGAYNFMEVKEDSSGLTIVPESHKTEHKAGVYKKDWVLISEKDVVKGQKLLIPANCLTLWNSKLTHANTGMTTSKKRFDRLTCYITYLPKSLHKTEIKQQKIKAYKEGKTTSHWANRCEVKVYPWGFGPQYEKKGFISIIPSEPIPEERLALF